MRGQGHPSGPAACHMLWLKPQPLRLQATSLVWSLASPGSDAPDGPSGRETMASGKYTCPVFLSVSRKGPTVFSEGVP